MELKITGIDLPDPEPIDINNISGRIVKEPRPKLTEEQMLDILLNTDIMDL